ncbi:MAG: ribosome-associated translation inhibitor RaiA [Bacteroidota bacterium]
MLAKIHSVGFTTDEKLDEYIQKKVNKLDTLYDKIINADIYLKLDSHDHVKDKIVEIKLNIPGATLFASETSKAFEESTDLVLDSIKRQLHKRKEKTTISKTVNPIDDITLLN